MFIYHTHFTSGAWLGYCVWSDTIGIHFTCITTQPLSNTEYNYKLCSYRNESVAHQLTPAYTCVANYVASYTNVLNFTAISTLYCYRFIIFKCLSQSGLFSTVCVHIQPCLSHYNQYIHIIFKIRSLANIIQ